MYDISFTQAHFKSDYKLSSDHNWTSEVECNELSTQRYVINMVITNYMKETILKVKGTDLIISAWVALFP